MIDITLVDLNSKTYSVKTKLMFNTQESHRARVTILSIDLVEHTGFTSIKKIKTIFDNPDGTLSLNRTKYGELFRQISYSLANKYKMKVLDI